MRTARGVGICFLVFFTASHSLGLAQSKYDQEIAEALTGSARYAQDFKHARSTSARAMKLYEQGTYLIDIPGQPQGEEKERLEEGIRRLKSALEIDPTFAAAHVSLGDAYRRRAITSLKGHRLSKDQKKALGEKARQEYLKAVELDPSNPLAHYRVARSSTVLVDRVRHFKKVLELDPNYDLPFDARAHVAEGEGRLQEAFEELIQGMAYFYPPIRCSMVKNMRPGEYDFGYFLKNYPKEYQSFVERVCADRELPPFRPGGGA